MSEYIEIFGTNGTARKGRPPLTAEERAKRAAIRKIETRRKQEARRRALAVLGHRYAEELTTLVATEYEALGSDDRFSVTHIA